MIRTNITLKFADGEYEFRLTLAGIQELQEKANAGFGEVFGRLLAGRYSDGEGGSFGMPTEAKWHVGDLLSTIRLGLIGGGKGMVDGRPVTVDAIRANQLIDAYVKDQPLKAAWNLAAAIVWACVEGIEDREHEVKKKPDRKPRAKNGSITPAPSASSPDAQSAPSTAVN